MRAPGNRFDGPAAQGDENIACQTPTALLLIVFVLVIRRILDGRRIAGWDAEWSATGPQWCNYR